MREITFSVARTAAWAPGIQSPEAWRDHATGEWPMAMAREPALTQMPALLRRRAGRLHRMACDVAYRALDGALGVPTIFCSRFGDASRAAALLTDLANGAALSPAAFSLSVHNAAGGLFSIARRDHANCITLAAGEASAAQGAIEACGLFAEGAERALLVIADCALPPEFAHFEDVRTPNYAWACLLEPAHREAFALSWEPADHPPAWERRPPAALEVLWFLQGAAAEVSHVAGDKRWRWSRRA